MLVRCLLSPVARFADSVTVTRALCDIPSVSGTVQLLADRIEQALAGASHLETIRDGNAIVARTHLGRSRRVVIAGHIDTVPVNHNLPTVVTRRDGEEIIT